MDEKELAALKKSLSEGLSDTVKSIVADAIKPIVDSHKQLAADQKVIADTIAGDKKAAEDAAKKAADDAAGAGEAKPLAFTQEQFDKAVEAKASKLIDDKLAARDQTAQQTAERARFIGEKLKDLPEVYRAKLGNDPAKWAADEQAIRDGLKADLKGLGIDPANIGGNKNAANQGGAGGGGGGAGGRANPGSGLSDGESKYAAEIVLPTAAAK